MHHFTKVNSEIPATSQPYVILKTSTASPRAQSRYCLRCVPNDQAICKDITIGPNVHKIS